ncbi:PIN domain-containing protein [Neobacillus pocheonensis]|uniref:type II toxin-antitoxin system VapC family toxin n=1 Tax=Neobacillus pocheonensis TaxID=363869 RepID=UPI003D26C215
MSIRDIIDNNIWAALEMGYPDVVSFLKQIIKDKIIMDMTTVIQMELFSHFEIDTDEVIRKGREKYLLLVDNIYPVTEEIAMLAGKMRRTSKLKNKKIPKGPDAMIAATAKIYNIPLVSNNDKDFLWLSREFDFALINPVKNNEDYTNFQQAYKNKRGLI